MGKAVIFTGTVLKIKVQDEWIVINGMTDFSGLGGGSATVIDTTDLSDNRKTKLVGIPDEGQIKLTLNYLPEDPGQMALEAARDTAAQTEFQFLIAKAGTTFDFDGFALSFDKAVGVDKQVTASVGIEITGEVTKGKAA